MADAWDPLWSVPMMKNAINTDVEMVKWALTSLYKKQTEEEKSYGGTKERNGQGFNLDDAYYGSCLAQAVIAGDALTDEEIHNARLILKKYAWQLTNIKNNE